MIMNRTAVFRKGAIYELWEESGCVHALHNEKFRINEEILPIGAAQYAQFAADYLEAGAGGEMK